MDILSMTEAQRSKLNRTGFNDWIHAPLRSLKRVKCQWGKCRTILNGYNVALRNKYCSVHAVNGFLRDDKLKKGYNTK